MAKRGKRTESKTAKVLEHLQKYGSITSWEAIEKYGATRLSSIIFNLRKNYHIDNIDETHTDKYASTEKFTRYIYHGAIK